MVLNSRFSFFRLAFKIFNGQKVTFSEKICSFHSLDDLVVSLGFPLDQCLRENVK